MLLFWKKGYSATSLKELEQVMALKPTSIYNAFGSKRELFQKALELYFQTALAGFMESLDSDKPINEALDAVLYETIRLHFNKAHPGGCMVVLSILENEQHDAETRKMLDGALMQLRDAITKRLEDGRASGEIDAGADCRTTANQVVALVTGMTTLAKAGVPRKELEALAHSAGRALL